VVGTASSESINSTVWSRRQQSSTQSNATRCGTASPVGHKPLTRLCGETSAPRPLGRLAAVSQGKGSNDGRARYSRSARGVQGRVRPRAEECDTSKGKPTAERGEPTAERDCPKTERGRSRRPRASTTTGQVVSALRRSLVGGAGRLVDLDQGGRGASVPTKAKVVTSEARFLVPLDADPVHPCGVEGHGPRIAVQAHSEPSRAWVSSACPDHGLTADPVNSRK
jgi:hypothetical protein